MTDELELVCPGCHDVNLCGPTEMLQRLQSVGSLRRDSSPDVSLLRELLRTFADRFSCGACGHIGLTVREPQDSAWPTARLCLDCRRPLAAERLEVFPHAERCAACEGGSRGADAEREFCPRCGTVMTVRLQSGRGVTRYVSACPSCTRR